ncbi:MAG: hypothetical protein ACK4K7_07320 [Allosphingosinicella sp.]|uniref:hypothetical protein n=1 Tax=Allosphingosinicella sp. TaxID=2823234 RepID=UPI0039243853
MIDNFSLALSHGLIMLALWRLLSRPDLDDPAAPPPEARPTANASKWARARGDGRRA